MRVLIVTPSFYPATKFGGAVAAIFAHCNAVSQSPGVELRVLTTDTAGSGAQERLLLSEHECLVNGYKVTYCPKNYGTDLSVDFFWRLPGEIKRAELVHLVGVYSLISLVALACCKMLRKPVVWMPCGALRIADREAKRWAKRIWVRICRFLLPSRALIHFASDLEMTESVDVHPFKSAVVPHSVDVNAECEGVTSAPRDSLAMLFMGRLHPAKALGDLLQAMATAGGTNSNLEICGSGSQSYVSKLHLLIEELNLEDRVTFKGHVDGDEREEAFRKADVLVLPSHSESFGVVVIEALARGRPVIASRGTPWSGLEARKCGLWVRAGPDDLARAIDAARNMDLVAMGQRGREWVRECFAPLEIGRRMVSLYDDLLDSPR